MKLCATTVDIKHILLYCKKLFPNFKMSSKKNESKNNVTSKGICKPFENKRSATALQISKVKTTRYNKSKLESSTCSRLPVCSKPRKLHNCIDPNNTPITFRKPLPSVLKRKSISLVELTSSTPKMRIWTPKKWESKERLDESKIKEIVQTKLEVSSLSSNETDIAKNVCKMFILNAWRHRRSQVLSFQNRLTKMGNEVDNLNIQVVVLRNLLESEKLRVAVSMSDAAHLKLRLENELKENSHLKNEISNLVSEKNVWKNQEAKMTSEMQSLKDELTLTSEQNKYLRRECDDFEKALSEVKQKEGNLQKQLDELTICLREKDENTKEIQYKVSALLARMSELKKRNQNLLKENENKERKINECINKINDMSVELNNSQNICKVQNENIANLKRDLGNVKEKVKSQTIDIENLKNTVEKYESEKEEFTTNLRKTRNRVIFEAIKISASLLFPYHPYL